MFQNQAINFIRSSLSKDPNKKRIITGLGSAAKAFFTAALAEGSTRRMLVVFSTQKEAESFANDLIFFGVDPSKIILFPEYNLLPVSFLNYHNKTAADRVASLFRLTHDEEGLVVVTSLKAVLHKTMPKKSLIGFAELVEKNEALDLDGLVDKLLKGGYTRCSLVEEPGDFAVRGGIVDIYPPYYENPVRLEFFGDEVESIRFFSPVSQRTRGMADEVVLLPAREVILEKDSLNDLIARIRREGVENQVPVSATRELIERFKNEGSLPGVESFIPLVYDRDWCLIDYLGNDSLILLDRPKNLASTASDLFIQLESARKDALQAGSYFVNPLKVYHRWEEFEWKLEEKERILFDLFPSMDTSCGKDVSEHFKLSETSNLKALSAGYKDGGVGFLVDYVKELLDQGLSVCMGCGGEPRRKRMVSLLASYNIPVNESPRPLKLKELKQAKKPRVFVTDAPVSEGFIWPEACLAVFSEKDLFGKNKRSKRVEKKERPSQFISIEELKKGDLVVHPDHGVGEYNGLERLRVDGHLNDFLVIRYRDDDRLYLPVERMNVVQKYIGAEGITPVLDKMGGRSWDRVKQRVKKSAERIAGELLNLYASRKVEKGISFDIEDEGFQEFEDAFPFVETPGQKAALDDVLEDMQKPTPMDRLICGDVGYGKTEVALRASYVAVANGKQVAVLVPTTVLAEQHYETFVERYEQYPVNIACLSRFRSPKEQRRIIEGLKKGGVDIVIGTHRILQKDISFRSLGLLILDEEHRFGVRHKEKLKEFKKTVDVLTLTATPIPRTLQMSLVGIRDVSIIATPPEQRRPIITYITEFDEKIIAGAIRNEIKRGGQVFFVHNHVLSIERMAARLKGLVPEARLAVAHGQMKERKLEEVMHRFATRQLDLLVCTTIIESGLDVSSANTIIINRADRFGLAQIYQIRGRVGRFTEQAYAYLIIPNESILTRDAQKRLKVLMEHSDLGSGFQIAMNDLRIRGAGTILGASQSGHIAAVGYEMFLQLMEEAVMRLKGQPVVPSLEPEIRLPVSAHFPDNYIPDIDQRLSLYRRMARMDEISEVADIRKEVADRYGPLPREAINLFNKIVLKVMCEKAGVKKLDLNDDQLVLWFSLQHQKSPLKILDMVKHDPQRFSFSRDGQLTVRLKKTGRLVQVKNLLKDIATHVNNYNFK